MLSHSYPDTLALRPVPGPVHAVVPLPGSKSLTNRALLLASLAEGRSLLHGPLHSEDTDLMADCLRLLGVQITIQPNGDLHVEGRGGTFAAPPAPLFTGNSGTTMRFLAAAACFAPSDFSVSLDGVERMRERPIEDLLETLRQLGIHTQSVHATGCPPVVVRGGGMRGGKATISGTVSSQFLSAVLMAAPLAASDVSLSVVGELVSKPYVELTRQAMQWFGADFDLGDYQLLHVKSGQIYRAANVQIEADASAASYFLAAAAVTGGDVTLSNLGTNSVQGDVHFVDVLEQMGCMVRHGNELSITGPRQLKAVTVDMESMPDVAPTLAVLCAFADGPSHITGLASLKVKECNRLDAMATELKRLGVGVEVGADWWTIVPPAKGVLHGAVVETYNDHRMAMSLAVVGLKVSGLIVSDPACVAKTFPDFWTRWQEAFPS